MNDFSVNIYTSSKELPIRLIEDNFFHSRELFQIVEESPGDTPFMAVATHEGEVRGQLLVIVHRRGSLVPPYLYTHAHAHGEGCYAKEQEAEHIFPLLLKNITLRLRQRLCFYIEFSEISKKMFGYRHLRRLGYFPVSWQEIHNSLHSLPPEERLGSKLGSTIESMTQKGVSCHEATSPEDIARFHQLLSNYYRFKLRRFIPGIEFFMCLAQSESAKIFLTTYGNKAIGGCACVYSQGNAYLWYAVGRRKTYRSLHPDTMTIWHALKTAHEMGCEHFHFMDAGLPWKHNPYREFILSFGGKPVAKLRWFRFYTKPINAILRWIFSI